jgi:hypothetical protein
MVPIMIKLILEDEDRHHIRLRAHLATSELWPVDFIFYYLAQLAGCAASQQNHKALAQHTQGRYGTCKPCVDMFAGYVYRRLDDLESTGHSTVRAGEGKLVGTVRGHSLLDPVKTDSGYGDGWTARGRHGHEAISSQKRVEVSDCPEGAGVVKIRVKNSERRREEQLEPHRNFQPSEVTT